MNTCPKCRSYSISGPRYGRSVYGEWLEYTCNRCGYQERESTADAESQASASEEKKEMA